MNVAVTPPYGHAGAYDTLEQVVAHCRNAGQAIDDWFDRGGVCSVERFSAMTDYTILYPDAEANSRLSLQQLRTNRENGGVLFRNSNLNAMQQAEIVAFLEALTDPCVEDPSCMGRWITDPATTGLDGFQLNGVDWHSIAHN